ncbi:MAG TPA: hypothetical protein VIW69_17740 [Candidatus Elarobacter sp.]
MITFPFNMAQDAKDVPAFLSAMGIANTMATFVFTSTLAKVAASKFRRRASFGIVLSWAAMVVAGSNYVFTPALFGVKTVLLDAGLLIWVLSFWILSTVVGRIANTTVNSGISWRKEQVLTFTSTFDEPNFGVPLIDAAIRRTRTFGTRIHYPFLLVHDIDSPGLLFARAFVKAGLDAGEAVIYFSFSRPATTIVQQLASHGICSDIESANVYVIDCYSRAYMPEDLHGPLARSKHVFYADPLDPADVYEKYELALRRARARAQSCRAVYETLSDFLKITDADLVMHYLRRTVVYEELKGIKSLYLFWSGALGGTVSEAYIQWFFSTSLELVKIADAAVPASKYTLKIEKLFSDALCLTTDDSFAADLVPLFERGADRIEELARRLAALHYTPKPYGFLRALRAAKDGDEHVANFVFFMVAIDHDTHSNGVRYEATVGSAFYHGSDLLYKMAADAKAKDNGLFLAKRMRDIGDDAVEHIFRTQSGVLPSDIPRRTRIFRECARFLLEHENGGLAGDVRELLRRSDGTVAGKGGVLERVARTHAYADPIAKKANLFCKIALREGLFAPRDRNRIGISIDHVVMTMALRSGIVTATAKDLPQKLEAGSRLDEYTVAVLREVTKSACDDVVRVSGAFADEVDDVLWSYGRVSLREATPLPDAAAITCELDARVEGSARNAFIELMNGVDTPAAAEPWGKIRTVNFPSTEYF